MRILAIGGGEIGRPGTKIETLPIDRRLVSLSGKKRPMLLFVPTASDDSEEYVKVIRKYFGDRLGCRVEVLLIRNSMFVREEARKKILAADLVYVGGGNTLKMLRLWRELGVDELLTEAARMGKVLAGVSAGAVCWFRYANSDSRKMNNPSSPYIRIRGLDFFPFLVAPHYDVERNRQASVKRMLRRKRQVAIGLDNCAALLIDGERYEVITSKPKARVRRCYWKGGEYHVEPLKGKEHGFVADLMKLPR